MTSIYHPVRNRYVLAADGIAALCTAFVSFRLRLGGDTLPVDTIWRFALVGVLVKTSVFFLFGLYRQYWRYASTREFVLILSGVGTAAVVMSATLAALGAAALMPAFPREVLVIDWLLTNFTAIGIRFSVRMMAEGLKAPDPSALASDRPGRRRVLVVGAGDAGALIVREMQRTPRLGYVPVGFLDDDPAKRRKRIHDVTVMGPRLDLEAVVVALRVDEVIIAMPTAPGTVVREVIEQCRDAGVSCRSIPGIYELLDGKVTVSRLRAVDIADLLRRAQIDAKTDVRYLQNRRVLVTGAGGSIGTELCRQVAGAHPSAIVLLGHGENSLFESVSELRTSFPTLPIHTVVADIRDAERLERVFRRFRPHIVFHAAAHKHVALMEENPEEAITNNILGTRYVVEAAAAADVERFVLVSTDKAVAPTSVMGASKRAAEYIVRDAARRYERAYLIVRFGNVLGSRGSVVQVFKRQIERGGPLTITHPDMTRFFMTIPEAVHLVLHAGGLGRAGELFVLRMGEPVRIIDLAEDLVRLSGVPAGQIPMVFTGVTPGEKLHESLWESESDVQPTDNPDIVRVIEPHVGEDRELRGRLDGLTAAARTGDWTAIEQTLADLVPTYPIQASPVRS